MSIIVSFISLILCIYFGRVFSEKYVLRDVFFEHFSLFNEKIINEVMYSQNTIKSLIENSGDNSFIYILKNYIYNKQMCKESYLTNEENEFVNEYLLRVGQGDKQSQLAFLNSIKLNVDLYKKGANEALKKYRPLYLKISLLIGLMFFIMFL